MSGQSVKIYVQVLHINLLVSASLGTIGKDAAAKMAIIARLAVNKALPADVLAKAEAKIHAMTSGGSPWIHNAHAATSAPSMQWASRWRSTSIITLNVRASWPTSSLVRTAMLALP